MIVVGIIAALIIASFIRSFYELYHLRTTEYVLRTPKLPEGRALKAVFISDLHCRRYGRDNVNLIERIRDAGPGVILIGGDMLCATPKRNKDAVYYRLLEELVKIAPVYMADGNHEKGMQADTEKGFAARYEKLEAECARIGVKHLKNASDAPCEGIALYGLDVDRDYYRKHNKPSLTAEKLVEYLGKLDEKRYNVLLAHNPDEIAVYAETGADLVLSGHLHGGTMVVPGIGGVLSPQIKLFPKYYWGRFVQKSTTMIVTAGCGSHLVNIRVFNKPEVVVIDICGETGEL